MVLLRVRIDMATWVQDYPGSMRTGPDELPYEGTYLYAWVGGEIVESDQVYHLGYHWWRVILTGTFAPSTLITWQVTVATSLGGPVVETSPIFYFTTNAEGHPDAPYGDGDPLPGKATIGVPPDGYTLVSIGQPYCTWTPGANTDTMDVYFNSELVLSDTTDEHLDLNTIIGGNAGYIPLAHGVTYTWRVDCKNEYGTTTGDTWSFTCNTLNAPTPSWNNYPGKTLGPGEGTVGVDFYWTSLNAMVTVKRLVAAAKNALWYEEI